MTLEVTDAALTGNQPVTVGKKVHLLPQRARVAHVKNGPRQLAYVLHESRVHCLINSGEIPVPDELQRLVKAKVFGVN